jgi:hypothetical protein
MSSYTKTAQQAPEPWIDWHLCNYTESDRRRDGLPPHFGRHHIPLHAALSIYAQSGRRLRLEWTAKKRAVQIGAALNLDRRENEAVLTVSVPFLSVYLTMNDKRLAELLRVPNNEAREIGLRIYQIEDEVVLRLHGWTDPDQGSAAAPWWRDSHVSLKDKLLGERTTKRTTVYTEERMLLIPDTSGVISTATSRLPSGTWQKAKIQIDQVVQQRPRLHGLDARSCYVGEITLTGAGYTHAGKGTDGHNIGNDAIFALSCQVSGPHAVEELVGALYSSGERYRRIYPL